MPPSDERPPHRRPGLLAAVAAGALAGALLRYLLSLAAPTPGGGWPGATFAVNLTGAFLLGALLEALGRLGPDVGGRRLLRLGLGTGLLGAYTTYSSLALDGIHLLEAGRPGLAALYGVGTVAGGAAAAGLGAALGATVGRARGAGVA